MLEINFDDYYVVNSSKQVFLFEKNDDDKIQSKDLKFISEESVKLYSASIDLNDNIYIIILSTTGELNLHIYNNISWSKISLAKFDVRANNYSQIELIIINDKVNILYSLSNLSSSNIHVIQHLVFGKTLEEKYNVIRYATDNPLEPFILDFDINGNIHLIYSNNSHIYYIFYNPYTKKWNQTPSKISTDSNLNTNPYLLIDSNHIIHCLWINKIAGNNIVKYKRMMSKGKDPYVWKDIILPKLLNTEFIPIIYEEENILKIPFYSGNTVSYIYSLDNGNSWIPSNESSIIDGTSYILNISSNLENDSKYKNLIIGLSQIIPENISNNEILNSMEVNEEEILNELNSSNSIEINNEITSEDLNKISLELLLEHQKEIEDLIIEVTKNQILFKEEILEMISNLDNKKGFWANIFGSPKH